MISISFSTTTNPPHFIAGTCTHLWLLDLSSLNKSTIASLQHLLPTDELTRAQSMRRNPDAAIAIRLFVRLCLAPYYDIAPQALKFEKKEKGKPYVANTSSNVHFNLSHTDDTAILAISQQNPIGVDIEKAERKSDISGIADNFFAEQEVSQIKQQDEGQKKAFFFRLWTLKEAFLKATGDGISIGLEKVVFNLNHDKIQLSLSLELNENALDWQFYQTFLTTTLCVAVAKKQAHPIQPLWFNGNNLFHQNRLTD